MEQPDLNYLQAALRHGEQRLDDTLSMGMLQSLITGYPYLPFSCSSLRPFCMVNILNDIVLNNHGNIIEFGSGLSTIMMARLIQKNKLDGKILSVDHHKGWVSILESIIEKEELGSTIELVYAPLKETSFGEGNIQWYDPELLDGYIGNRKFDLVIIDGPPAWEKGKEMARYPALPYIIGKLNSNFSIYLDDANRSGEQSILQQWTKDYSLEFKITGGTLACYCSGNFYSTSPANFC
jgi:hypothetical protein